MLPGRTAGKSFRTHLWNISEEMMVSVGLHSNLYCFPYSMNSPTQGSQPWKAVTTLPGFICCPWNALSLLPDMDGQPLQCLFKSSTLHRYTLDTLAGCGILSWKRFFIFCAFWFAFSEAGIIAFASPSCLPPELHLCLYVWERDRNAHPPLSLFCTIFFTISPGTEKMHCCYTIITQAWQFNVLLLLSKVEMDENKQQNTPTFTNLHKPEYVPMWKLPLSTKMLCDQLTKLTACNSWSCYCRATNFIFIWRIEKIIHYTSGCTNTVTWHLRDLIKEENLGKNLIQHAHMKWLAKRIAVIPLLTKRAQNLLGRMLETKEVEVRSGFSSPSLCGWFSSLFLFFLPLPHQGNSSPGNLGLYLSRILPQDKNQSSDPREWFHP